MDKDVAERVRQLLEGVLVCDKDDSGDDVDVVASSEHLNLKKAIKQSPWYSVAFAACAAVELPSHTTVQEMDTLRERINRLAQSWHEALQRIALNSNEKNKHGFIQETASDVLFLPVIDAMVIIHIHLNGALRRHLTKAIKSLNEHFAEQTEKSFFKEFSHLLGHLDEHNLLSTIANVASIMDMSQLNGAIPALGQNMERWIQGLSRALKEVDRRLKQSPLQNEAITCSCIKAYVTTLQRMESFNPLIFSETDTATAFRVLQRTFASIINASSTPRDVLMMAAMAIGYTINFLTVKDNTTLRSSKIVRAVFCGEEIGKISAFCFNFAKEAVVTIYTCVVFRFSKKKSIDWETTIKSLKTQQLRMVLAASHTLISTSPIEVLFHQVDFSDLLGLDIVGTIHTDIVGPLLLVLTHPLVPEPLRHSAYTVMKSWIALLVDGAKTYPEMLFTAGALRFHTEDAPSLDQFIEIFLFRDWEDPVDSVRDCISVIFSNLLKLDSIADKSGTLPSLSLAQGFAGRLLALDWRIKGRYPFLSLLIPHVGLNVLLTPSLRKELILCSQINTLHKSSEAVYFNCLKEIRRVECAEQGRAETEYRIACTWYTLLGEVLVGVLEGDAKDTRSSTSSSWITKTIRLIPHAMQILLRDIVVQLRDVTDLHHRAALLRRYMLFLMAGKKAGTITSKDIDDAAYEGTDMIDANHDHYVNLKYILEALKCSAVNVRLDTMAFLCYNVQTAAEPSDHELRLIRLFLLQNMSSTSSTHRQRMFNSLNLILNRLKDSWLAALNSSDKIDAKAQHILSESAMVSLPSFTPSEAIGNPILPKNLQIALDAAFGDINRREKKLTTTLLWVIELCQANLFQSACYQRRCSAVQVLRIVTAVIRQIDSRRCPKALFNALSNCIQILIHALRDNFDETRELTCDLLIEIYHHVLRYEGSNEAKSHSNVTKYPAQLWDSCLSLVDSPKATASETAGTYIRAFASLAFYQIETGSSEYQAGLGQTLKHSHDKLSSPPVAVDDLFQYFSKRAFYQMEVARLRPLYSAKALPIHGTTEVLCGLIDRLGSYLHPSWQQWFEQVIELCKDIIDFCLKLVSHSATKDTIAMPSFEDMGTSLTSFIVAEKGDVEADYPFMMSFVWLNLRNSCRVLASIVRISINSMTSSNNFEGLTKLDLLTNLKDTMCKVLKRCRHRGVIESVAEALTTMTSVIFKSNDASLEQLPNSWLENEICMLEKSDELQGLSVTRRSAGLPHIIHSLLSAHPKKSACIYRHIDRLLDIANLPPEISPDTQDIRQVHCMNVLKTLFGDSCLHIDTQPFVSKVAVLAVRGFSSTIWSIRNSSLQLFGVLLQRILGGIRLQADHRFVGITTQDFISRYSDVWKLILDEIDVVASPSASQARGYNQMHLFAILTLLSKLQTVSDAMSPATSTELAHMLKQLEYMTKSPVFSVRSCTSRALVGLAFVSDRDKLANEWIIELFPPSQASKSYAHNNENAKHGKALSLLALLQDELAMTNAHVNTQKLVMSLSKCVPTADDEIIKWWYALVNSCSPETLAVLLDVIGVLWILINHTCTRTCSTIEERSNFESFPLIFQNCILVEKYLCDFASIVTSKQTNFICPGAQHALQVAGYWIARLAFSVVQNGHIDRCCRTIVHLFDTHKGFINGLKEAVTTQSNFDSSESEDGNNNINRILRDIIIHCHSGLSATLHSNILSVDEKFELLLMYAQFLEVIFELDAFDKEVIVQINVSLPHEQDNCQPSHQFSDVIVEAIQYVQTQGKHDGSLQDAWLAISGLLTSITKTQKVVDVLFSCLETAAQNARVKAQITSQQASLKFLFHARFAIHSFPPEQRFLALKSLIFHLLSEDDVDRTRAAEALHPLLCKDQQCVPLNEQESLNRCFQLLEELAVDHSTTCAVPVVEFLTCILLPAEIRSIQEALFAREDLNPYAERVRLLQLAAKSLLQLSHPGLPNPHLERLYSLDSTWPNHIATGALHTVLFSLSQRAAYVAQFLSQQLASDKSFCEDVFDGQQQCLVYQGFVALGTCVYLHHVLEPSPVPNRWNDLSVFEPFPNLFEACLAWRMRSELHSVRLLRSGAFFLNRAVCARHQPNPSPDTQDMTVLLVLGILLFLREQDTEDVTSDHNVTDIENLKDLSMPSMDGASSNSLISHVANDNTNIETSSTTLEDAVNSLQIQEHVAAFDDVEISQNPFSFLQVFPDLDMALFPLTH